MSGAPRPAAPPPPPGRPVRHVVVGARGGQGTTTVAVALAALSAERAATVLVAHDREAVRDAVGLPPQPEDQWVELAPRLILSTSSPLIAPVTVVDAGSRARLDAPPAPIGDVGPDERRWLVLRGPCYLSLRAAADASWRPDGVVLLREPGRAITSEMVADVLASPVVVVLHQDRRVAGAVDAGTLLRAAGRLDGLASLRALLDPDVLSPGLPGRVTPDSGRPRPGPVRRVTDQLDRLEGPGPGAGPVLGR